MKRRSFLKGAVAAGAATLLPSSLVSLAASGCRPAAETAPAWDFDEIIDRSGTWSIKQRRAEGDKLAMWIADMDFKTDPVVEEALRQRLDTVMGYTYTPDEFYDAIVGWEKSQHEFEVEKEWVGFAPGVITSLCQAYLTFSEPGDKIIVQPPVYDPFMNFARRLGREIVFNPLVWKEDHYEMDFAGLEQVFDARTKLLVLCNPHNPIGIIWDRETLARLADLCERHGVMVISDEIHADLSLYGKHHFPFCSVSPAAARIGMSLASISKSFNLAGVTGMAYSIIPDARKREQYQETLHRQKLGEPSVMTLTAFISAYSHEPVWLNAVKRYLEGNIEYVGRFFADRNLGIKAILPQASFLVWLDCRELDLPQEKLLALFNDEAGVVVNNGASYGPGGEGFVRLNIGCPRSIVVDALARIERAVARL